MIASLRERLNGHNDRAGSDTLQQVEELRDLVSRQEANLDLLREATLDAELVLAAEDVGWERPGQGARDMPREVLGKVITRSRRAYLRDPLINRGVNVQALYVFAQGVNVQAADKRVNEMVQAFWDDPANQAELTGHQARFLKEVDLQVTGNLFFTFFVNPADGTTRVRTIPPEEITEIIFNPEDSKDPWWYRREWTETDVNGRPSIRVAYYPDWGIPRDAVRPVNALVEDVPVYHVKVGCLSDAKFGVPETYQALDWGQAYKEFLSDRATISRALSRFAFKVTTPGGKAGVAAAKTKLATTIGSSTTETNPAPVTGSTFIRSTTGADLDPVKVAGATINPEEGRRFLLMVAASFGVPETFFSDVSTGNLATAKSLDRPTELKFRERQSLWADIFQNIIQFMLQQKVRAHKLATNADLKVEITFPSILEHDTDGLIKAIVSAATLDGKQSAGTLDDRTLVRLLLQALGVDQIDELLDKIAPEDGEGTMAQLRNQNAQRAQEIAGAQPKMAQPKSQNGDEPPDEQGQQQEAFTEALRELREAVQRVIGG